MKKLFKNKKEFSAFIEEVYNLPDERPRKYKHGNYTKQPLDWKQVIDHIRMNILDIELQLFAATALVAAPRVGEIIELKVKDVTGGFIMIEKTKCKIKHGVKTDPYRLAAKPEWYDKMLNAYLPLLNRKPNDYLFQNKRVRAGGKLTVQGANYRIGLIFKQAGLDPKGQLPTMHTFRKTAATFMFNESGGNIRLVQQFLGHKSIENTIKYLNNPFDEYVAAAKQYMA